MKLQCRLYIFVLLVGMTNCYSVKEKWSNSGKVERLLSLLKKEEETPNSRLCYDDEGNAHTQGARFLKDDGCASCWFDAQCKLDCVPSNETHCGGYADEDLAPVVCRTDTGSWHHSWEVFTVFDSCYSCVFNRYCGLRCVPNGQCKQSAKGCEYNGQYYGVGEEFEGTCSPGWCEFDTNCNKICVCSRDILDLLLE